MAPITAGRLFGDSVTDLCPQPAQFSPPPPAGMHPSLYREPKCPWVSARRFIGETVPSRIASFRHSCFQCWSQHQFKNCRTTQILPKLTPSAVQSDSITPNRRPGCEINHCILYSMLNSINYDPVKIRYIVDGLSRGFRIHYQGPSISRESDNHKSARDNPKEIDNKLQKELAKGYISGPFERPPFKNFIVSPLGLVPKKTPNQFRIIHDLSFPKDQGVNAYIPREFCSVQYKTLDDVVHLVI